MDIGMGLFLGLLIGVMLIVALFWGMHLGMELAVDSTGKKGHFTAYGKCYAAIEIPWRATYRHAKCLPRAVLDFPTTTTKDRNAV